MSDFVIKAENIGKKYTIGHQAERGRYTALRDVLMQNARNLWNRTKDLATGQPIIQGDTLEEVWVLEDVNFEIRRGEAVGIIGRNGAGKSTLLKILSRITEPSTGRVTIKGRVASLLEVGTGFHPELSGRENIYLNGTILGMTRVEIRQKFDEIVAFAEVEKYLDTPVKRYSSGMYVRLAFSVAAHLEPEILLIDEVLAVGDVAFQKKCLGKMEHVSSEGRTVIFVSHDMSAIQKLCSRGFVISQGGLSFEGESFAAVNNYFKENTVYEQIDLRSTKERTGNGTIRFTRIKFCNSHDEPIGNLPVGEGCNIYLDYESYTSTIPSNVEIGIAFISTAGVKVAMVSNVIANRNFEKLQPSGTICCSFPSLPLASNDYILSISFSSDNQTCDWVDKALDIKITEGDFYNSGRHYRPGSTCVYLQHDWQVI